MPGLEEVMGADYKADMTADEITSYFKNKILSTGEYESKAKVDAERKMSAQKINDLQNQIKGSLSDEELKAQERKALEDRIKELEENNRLGNIEKARLKAEGSLAETRVLMGIEGNDKDFTAFLTNVSSEDSVKTENISKYVNKLIKDAYEKGKADSIKNSLGKMSEGKLNGSEGKEDDEDIAMQKKILASRPKAKEIKKSNFI